MPAQYISRLQGTHRIRSIGHKAAKLRFLADRGFPTPAAYVCNWEAHACHVQGDEEIAAVLGEAARRRGPEAWAQARAEVGIAMASGAARLPSSCRLAL